MIWHCINFIINVSKHIYKRTLITSLSIQHIKQLYSVFSLIYRLGKILLYTHVTRTFVSESAWPVCLFVCLFVCLLYGWIFKMLFNRLVVWFHIQVTQCTAEWDNLYTVHIRITKFVLFVWGFSSHLRFFHWFGNVPFPVKGWKYWLMLSTYGHWTVSILEHVTPCVTWNIRLQWSSSRIHNTHT